MTGQEALLLAAAQITPATWCQHAMRRNAAGDAVALGECGSAVQWCALGHLLRVTGDGLHDDAAEDAIARCEGLIIGFDEDDVTGEHLVIWQDAPGRTADEVVDLFRRAAGTKLTDFLGSIPDLTGGVDSVALIRALRDGD